jgi:membrane protein YqaA with SNARE-associated domain
MPELTAYIGLFMASFLAATILPGSSEVALAGLAMAYPQSALPLFAVATAGNTLGALVNWWLGRSLMRFAGSRWFPATTRRIEQASEYFQRFGSWPLLFSWVPVIGDPMTIAAGVLRIRLPVFIPLVLIGKAARYAAVIFVTPLAS